MEDREPPPPYFGDYPHGAYWSAVVPEGEHDEEEDYSVAGPELRVMWDESAGPLWDESGLLPDDPAWLRRALSLSDSLVADLLAWLRDKSALHYGSRVEGWPERSEKLDERGRDLAARVQSEVGSQYVVRYRP